MHKRTEGSKQTSHSKTLVVIGPSLPTPKFYLCLALFSRAYNYFMYGLVGELADPTRFWHWVQSSFLRPTTQPLASCVDTVKTLPSDFALYSYSNSVTKSFASLTISVPPGSLRTHGFELSVALRPQRPYGQLGTGSP